jgi:hypothetical protein
MPDDVQPEEGQGGEATGGLFDSYLQTVPEDARDTVASYLKDASKGVEGRLQEAAAFRKTWEPFSQIEALKDYQPEDLSQLVAWHQSVVSNPDAYKEWLAQAAKEAGLTPAEEKELSTLEEDGELTREEVQKLIQEQAEQRVAPLQERLEQFESQQVHDLEENAIRQVFADIESAEKIKLTEDQKQAICELGMAHVADAKGTELPMGDASWVKAGFDRYRQIVSEGQRAFVDEKVRQPNPPLTPGGAPAAQAPKTFDEASKMALGRLRQQS